MNRILLLFVGFYLLTGCNGNEESSPYSEVLAQPPYSVLTDSIKKEPKRDELYFRRAVLLNKNNFPEPALADFRKAWSLRQDESYAIGVSNILMDKKPGDAVTFLKEALNALPKSLFLRLSLARAYNKLDKTDEALGICNAILLEQPDQVNTLMLQTELFEKMALSACDYDRNCLKMAFLIIFYHINNFSPIFYSFLHLKICNQ